MVFVTCSTISITIGLSLGYDRPKILYTKISDKMTYANSANPDQTVTKGAV